MEDESVSVTSPLANEKGNKRRILDSNGNYVSLVCVDSSSKADTAHTPKGKNADCGEWNPMLFKTEDEDKHKIECNSQKTSFDDLMRFSCQEINHVSKEGKEKHEAHDHILSGAKRVDLVKKELIYLDSLPSKSAHVRRMRMRCIKKLALYMEDLLLDPSFYTKGTTPNPIVSEFSLVIPKDLGQQANNSNDCAIWVITWMEKMKADVYKIDVDDGTRLRIALNLTMNSYNKLNDEILARSMQQIDKWGKA